MSIALAVKVDTTVNVADILTKDLGRKVHRRHREVLMGGCEERIMIRS